MGREGKICMWILIITALGSFGCGDMRCCGAGLVFVFRSDGLLVESARY